MKRRILLQGIDDDSPGEGRGKIPAREPWKPVPKVYGKTWATKGWVQCNEWLKPVINMGKDAPEKGWQRAEQEWVDGRGKHKKTLQIILSLKEYDPHKLFWQYLEEVRQLGIHNNRRAEKDREERERTEYLKNIQDTIFACKALRNQGNGETTHLTDADTNEVIHCVSKMHEWIMKAWMPLFRMYEVNPEPTWLAFRTEYENELREWFAECP